MKSQISRKNCPPDTIEPDSDPVTVLLILPTRIAMDVVSSTIEAIPEFRIVGWCRTDEEAQVMLKKVAPDIVLMDEQLPGCSGTGFVSKSPPSLRRCRFVVLVDPTEQMAIHLADKARVPGLLDRSGSSLAEMIQCIRSVAAGRRHWSAALTSARHLSLGNPDFPGKTLSDTEQRVLQFIALGLKNSEIAKRLNVSSATVRTHRGRIMKKLNIPSTPKLIFLAYARGLVPGLDPSLARP